MSDNQFDADIPEPSEQLDQLQPEDTLIDRGVDDTLDEGIIPPDRWSSVELRADDDVDGIDGGGESISTYLEQEEPDTTDETADQSLRDSATELSSRDGTIGDREVGDRRSGRLVAPDTVGGDDVESELFGTDVGIDGGAASAEEAAVHVIEDNPDTDQI
ncbi:DUF5709 domain-containing protein [Microlunatus sp. Y2014]|uniref:DUF5709 domain-containing protein n=1 Tax=Microlunatus sp. Y2014 TaxID=3418488 RepID=UPI003DA71959